MKKRVNERILPKLVERVSDGDILRLNKDNETYSFVGHGMYRPYKYTYGRLFEDKRCLGEFREFRGVDLDYLIGGCSHNIKAGKDHSLFVLRRRFMLRTPIAFGNYFYNIDETLKKRFNSYLDDADFSKMGYTDITGGPLESEQNTRESWVEEIVNVLRGKEPENLVFYLRRDPKLIAARILISISDFQGGLTQQEARKEYGDEIFKKMDKHLRGIALTRGYDGKIRIPHSDLNRAHKNAIGQEILLEELN